uniref:H/ACA snoRNP protein NHP2 n=1 Tax=Moina brachiata TaxID=675436 RepID=A0A4Y7NJH3_9CRUS|nr:EOG090X0JRW [Moina brachiata]SVE93391.1 EOG090X0JRW [Moina brachiata]
MAKKAKQQVLEESNADTTMDASMAETEDKKSAEKQRYAELLNHVSIIAQPMASRKLTRKIYKLLKKASQQKGYVRNGLKDVQRRIRLGERGIVIFAGDVTPVDIMCHMPAVCEEKSIPYCYTPSRMDLGHSLGLKRTSLMVLVKEHPEYKPLYDELAAELKALPTDF